MMAAAYTLSDSVDYFMLVVGFGRRLPEIFGKDFGLVEFK
jgi:hypothetical protein